MLEERLRDLEEDELEAFFLELATQLELDLGRFAADYSSAVLADRPLTDREEGRAAGVNSTPTLFMNGLRFRDDESYTLVRAHIVSLISE